MFIDNIEKKLNELKEELSNKINIYIKSTKYYKYHKNNINLLCKEFCINNIYNLIGIYFLIQQQQQNIISFFFGEAAYSRNAFGKEEFRITFAFLPNTSFSKKIISLNNIGYKLNTKDKNLIQKYMDNNKEKFYNLGISFQEKNFSGLKLYLNCKIKDIFIYFPKFYKKLIGTNEINKDESCLLGLNIDENGNLKDYKLYGNFKFMKEQIMNSVESKYHNIINDKENNFVFRYLIRIDKNGNYSYKINSRNFNNKNLLNIFNKYYPETKALKYVKIIGIGFKKHGDKIKKVDKYLLY